MDCYIRKMVEDGKVIFPKKFVLTNDQKVEGEAKESVEQLKLDLSPSEFSSLYMNDPVASDAIEFKPEWFRQFGWDDQRLPGAVCVMSLDPAFRLKQTNDFSGIVVSKISTDNTVFVLEAMQVKLNAKDLVSKIFSLVDTYNPSRLLVETVAAQLLLVDLLRDEMKRRNVFFVIEEVQPNTDQTKAIRIRGLIPSYANGRVLHRPGLKELENQLMEFPRGLHDDIIDALAYQVPFWKAPDSLRVEDRIIPGTFAWWKNTAKKPRSQLDKLFNDFRYRR